MVDLNTISWERVIGKDARDARHADDLGTIQAVDRHYVITEKGLVDKEKLYLPKYLAHGYDGEIVWFHIAEEEKSNFKRKEPPSYKEYSQYIRSGTNPVEIENSIPVVEKSRSDID